LRCGEGTEAEIVDGETDQVLYPLNVTSCPYPADSWAASEGVLVVIDYNPIHDLLAVGASIWAQRDGRYEQVLKLTSQGFMLEFTEDGEYLRARNRNAWKVYAVADILAAIDAQVQSAYPPT